jgi:geranylgeranyl diphosphate synthase type I
MTGTAVTSTERRTAAPPSILDRSRGLVEPALEAALARLDPWCRHVATYHLGWCDADGRPTPGRGGKMVRPALALLAAEAVGAPVTAALPGAVAVELVHNFSLLHDDLMDRDVERRHRRTVWSIWGPATAILAGDALLALAHEILLEAPAARAARAAWLLAGATRELTRGQVADLAFETRDDVGLDECIEMARAKTGALLAASAGIGAVLADAPQSSVEALITFGREVGLAFQLVDDVLGIWGDPAVTGKPVHSDLRSRKKSLPVAWAAARPAVGPVDAAARGAGEARDVGEARDAADVAGQLHAWLAGPDEPTDEVVAGVAELLDRAGARAWALEQAEACMRQAEQALTLVDIKPQARAELIQLAHYVVDRSS